MFLGYDWLVKHNLEVNWNIETIQFIKYPNIIFRTRRVQAMETQDKEQQEIGKESDPTNLEDLLEYI